MFSGDIFYMNMIGQPVVVLNSAQAASDLLEKRSAIYSDRVGSTMVNHPTLLVYDRTTRLVAKRAVTDG
jgi:hypothetical protein